ncbi:sigma-70 family RNA polymerase sigma factor [Streptomyces sp. NBC_01619]|uniref:sigma-70 family RNA polymerase sigma factor n=1 Tax=unclassified Streptomyces TaxID=2593676 RepID=UPI0022592691|nr:MULTISPECIES: sigma-70 family RNA polymerase sigma factor [unclassified Streptomyces]MCX4512822.1 sigma-70 family RNA polymerase sigma factor [Streptomyces sp. NBC_01619]
MSDLATTQDLESRLESYRTELTGYCYRMLGSAFEAEDAVQDTMVRAWKSFEKFEGRSSLRSWLYRIATNVCLDMLNAGNRRARPMDLTAATPVAQAQLTARPEITWLEPVPDGRVLPSVADPADTTVERESIRLAFVAALQHLPPKQRAVLILREVLAWKAAEVAELLGTSVASVNSALQRARATLADHDPASCDPADLLDEEQQKLLERYVAAFEGYDMKALTALLHEDATMSMPPYDLWLRGHDDIVGWMLGVGEVCRGSKLVPTVANGSPAFAQYHPSQDGEGYEPWALIVLEVSDGRIGGMDFFLDTKRWFPLFGLPERLSPEGAED